MRKEEKKKMNLDMKIFITIATLIAIGLTILIVYMAKPDDIASVGKNKIDNDEFKFYYTQALQPYIQSRTQLTEDIISYLKQLALEQAVQMEVLLNEAKESGFEADENESNEQWNLLEERIRENADENGITAEEFSKNYFGVGLKKAEKIIKNSIIAQNYFQEKSKEITFSEEDLIKLYEENRGIFDNAVIRHILFKVPEDADESVVEEKKKLADDILLKVNNGEDFAQLAKEHSEDTGSKDNGGMYEIRRNGQMVKEFEDWTFSHEAGDTGIVKTEIGFHVMKLDSINNTFEALRDNVQEAYQIGEYQKILNELMQAPKYKLEIKPGFENFE